MISKKVSSRFMVMVLTVLMTSSVLAYECSTHSETEASPLRPIWRRLKSLTLA